jgi:uncharacterized membrane protein
MYLPLYSMWEAEDIREFMRNTFKEPKEGWHQYTDFYVTILGGIFSYFLKNIVLLLTWNFVYRNCKETKDEEVRLAKTVKACDCLYKAIYFLAATIWGYVLLQDENFLPPALLGQGSYSNINKLYPYHNYKYPEGVRIYYLFTLGYHIH